MYHLNVIPPNSFNDVLPSNKTLEAALTSSETIPLFKINIIFNGINLYSNTGQK